ncbi:MAG: efflux RND transporter permease subunit [Isosphaeraceae bacterium]
MISRFFIDRPIFASVLSIVITLAGGIALFLLPLSLYPPISPPTVSVDCSYPGASARVVAETVATPIEQQVNGVENMMYMSSQCTNDGGYNLTVTFKHGVDLNMAQVLVQNRVALALPNLPDVLKQTGVNVRKRSPDILMAIAVNSPTQLTKLDLSPAEFEPIARLTAQLPGAGPCAAFGLAVSATTPTHDQLFLSNFALLHVKDVLARLPGVSEVNMLGQRDYSMRVWVDPDKLASRDMTASDVVAALRAQNLQVASGQIGQPPAGDDQIEQIPLSTLGRLTEPEQFEQVVVKTGLDGRIVRLRDVARVELGAKNQDISGQVNGRPSVSLAIFQLPDANALDVADTVKAKIQELASEFPPGVAYEIRYDTTPFIRESIGEVFKTLRDAVILVAVVVLLFLQNWRSALIPLVAVPVAVVGTFAVMSVFGFSLNNLTLFGLVLAIGIVVDDAIVVVEAVEHHIEAGLSPREATIRAMEQVSGPVIAIGLVLSAVFVPCAFITGIVGQFFRQFALTIATSTIISAFNSLTLSPALAALLLRPRQTSLVDVNGDTGDHASRPVRMEALPRALYALLGAWLGWVYLRDGLMERVGTLSQDATTVESVAAALAVGVGGLAGFILSRPLDWLLGSFFAWFNRGFQWTTGVYTRIVGGLLRVSLLVLVVYGGLLGLTYWGFTATPTGFIPAQDKGFLLVNIQLPDSTSVEKTQKVMRQIEQATKGLPGVRHTVAIAGQSFLLNANAPNFGAMYVMLEDFHARTRPELSGDAIAETIRTKLEQVIPDGLINVFGAPPVEGLGTAGGFKVILEDRGDSGLDELQSVAERIVADGTATPGLAGLFTSFRANTPWLFLDIDRAKLNTMGVSMAEVFNTLQVYLGSLYVNDFNKFGRTWQVNVQGDASFRKQIADLKQLKIRGAHGGMVPLGAVSQVRDVTGPVMLMRYNMYPAAAINGVPAPGVSSGQAIERMEKVIDGVLPPSMRFEWTELALLQLETGITAMLVFVLAVVLVFLVLAAQYESWSLPMAVILVVPMCLLCSVAGVAASGMDINIFTQVGFIVLVGLACKNAILIVEFAKARREAGDSRREATLEACALRLRPIMMTSFAFILGVVPLMLSEGAGAEMRRTLGTAVFSGMLGVTLFGIFLTPVFFSVIQWFSDHQHHIADPDDSATPPDSEVSDGAGRTEAARVEAEPLPVE